MRLKPPASTRSQRRAVLRRRQARPRRLRIALRVAVIVLPVLAVSGAGFWIWTTGRVAAFGAQTLAGFERLTAEAGWRVDKVVVEGRTHTQGQEILVALNAQQGQSLFAFHPSAARVALESLPWVRRARVERRLPGTIRVVLEERRPMAFWQKDGQLALVDSGGIVLAGANLGDYAGLPVLVGREVPAGAEAFIQSLDSVPDLKRRLKALAWMGGRRWSLYLEGGAVIHLPADDPQVALATLADMERAGHLLERDVSVVDLRQPDRVVVRVRHREAENMKQTAKTAEAG